LLVSVELSASEEEVVAEIGIREMVDVDYLSGFIFVLVFFLNSGEVADEVRKQYV
jgi:hypothetical protein